MINDCRLIPDQEQVNGSMLGRSLTPLEAAEER
jgi:hypothetical protein